MRRRLAAATVVLTALVPLVPAAPAAAKVSGGDDLLEALGLLGLSPEQAGEVAALSITDPVGDGNTFPPNQNSQPADDPLVDIVGYGTALVEFDAPAFGSAASATFPCGAVIEGEGVYVCAGEAAGLDGPVGMIWFTTRAPLPVSVDDPDTIYNLNAATYSEGAERWSNAGEFEYDTFRGTNRWHEVLLTQAGWRLAVSNIDVPGSEGTPVEVDSSAFAIVHGRAVVLLIPTAELDPTFDAGDAAEASQALAGDHVTLLPRQASERAWRGFMCSIKRFVAAVFGLPIMDSCGRIDRGPNDLLQGPMGEPFRVDPASFSQEGSAPADQATPSEDGDGGGFPVVAIVVGGGIGIGIGILVMILRRGRSRCDWAAYYDQGGKRVPLRTAQGKECCVYVVKLTSTINDADFAAKGDQSADRLDGVEAAPQGRLRIFDYDIDFLGLAVQSWASARTGPFGRQDWMQMGPAANRPRTPKNMEPNESYRWQMKAHEEDPDAAIHVMYDETTRLTVTLTSMCPDHQNEYRAKGEGSSTLQANGECSNSEPGPECPVELTAQSFSYADVNGDLNYRIDAQAASDTDEMEGAGGGDVREINGVTFYGSHLDSHDHDTRARQTYDVALASKDTNVVQGDAFGMNVDHKALLDSGMIVPARVYDTTEVVTADVFVDFDHDIEVHAKMQRTTCAKPGVKCCDSDVCTCAPELKVIFKNQAARIECDGKTFPLNRNNFGTMFGMALGGAAPWDIG